MKRSSITCASLISLAAGLPACAGQIPGLPAASATPTLEPYAVPVTYRNVSLLAPPFYTNRVTAEQLELREQMSPADDMPGYQRIIIQESADFHFGPDVSRPNSQILVYPLADLIQAFPGPAAAASQLQVVLGPGDAAPDYAAIAQELDRVPPESFHLTLEQCDALVRSLAVAPWDRPQGSLRREL